MSTQTKPLFREVFVAFPFRFVFLTLLVVGLDVRRGFGQQKSIAKLQCLCLLICVALWDGEHTEAVAFDNSVFVVRFCYFPSSFSM